MDVRHFVGHEDMVHDVALLPDGVQLISASRTPSPALPSRDTSLRLWDIASGREITRQTIAAPVIFQIAAFPDSRLLIANSLLFEAMPLTPLGQLQGHAEGVWVAEVTISRDSSRWKTPVSPPRI